MFLAGPRDIKSPDPEDSAASGRPPYSRCRRPRLAPEGRRQPRPPGPRGGGQGV